MAFTEIRNINGKKYYYRVISIRKGDKISKRRVYLGSELSKAELFEKEKNADRELLSNKNKKINREIGKIKKKIIPILKKNKVVKAGIFGSYSRGEQKKNSDVDIVVKIEDKKMSLIGFIGIQLKLEDALRKKVDLVEYSALHHLLRNKILNEEIPIL